MSELADMLGGELVDRVTAGERGGVEAEIRRRLAWCDRPVVLTERQREIARMIEQAGERAPSQREIAARLGISHPTVHEHIEAMIRRGILERDSGRARAIWLTPAGHRAIRGTR